MQSSRRYLIAIVTAVVAASMAPAQTIPTEMLSGQPVAAGEVLVKPRPGLETAIISVFDALNAESIKPVGNAGLLLVKSSSLNVAALLSRLTGHPWVANVQPNYILHAHDTIPNDTNFGNLWGLRNTGQVISGQTGVPLADIEAVKAWDLSVGSSSIAVGVIDTGLDYTHGDLAGNVWSSPFAYELTFGNTVIGCPPNSHGFNAIKMSCDPMDDHWHGTHVSGTIGALGNNGSGVTGVNWRTTIVGLKFLDSTGNGTTADAINCITAAIQLKQQGINIRILNASWGGSQADAALFDAIDQAGANDLLFVASAGNSSQDIGIIRQYPASYANSNMISVAATDNQDHLASFSSYSSTLVHLGAPGVNILSTYRGGGYAYASGTSMAAPHVSGAAALILSQCSLNTAALKANLLSNVDPVSALISKTITAGRLNVYRSLSVCGGSAAPSFTLSANASTVTVAAGASGTSTITVTPLNGFVGTVLLSASGTPPGVTAGFVPNTVSGSGTSMLTLSTTSATTPGTYPITIQGTSGSLSTSTTVNLTVNSADFSLSANPSSMNVARGGSNTSTITVTGSGGFSAGVTLSASGAPAGVTVGFSPSVVSGSGTSTATVSATTGATPGTYPITITGASGALSHTTSINVTVTSQPDFSISASPTSVTASPGGSAASTITVTASGGFSGVVSLSANGLPSGVTASFSPNGVTGSGPSTLTLFVASTVGAAAYPITIQGVSGTLTHTTPLTLNVTAQAAVVLPPTMSVSPGAASPLLVTLSQPAGPTGLYVNFSSNNFSVVSVSPVYVFIPPGQTTNNQVNLYGLGNGTATVTASAAGYSSGTTAVTVGTAAAGTMTFNPSSAAIVAPASQNLTLTFSPAAPSSGLTVTLNLSNPSAASVPSQVTVGANATNVLVQVTGVNQGLASITATAPGYNPVIASVTVSNANTPLTIKTTSLASGQVNSSYMQTLTAGGGTMPYTWSLMSGTLPTSLSLAPSGTISGTPAVSVTNLSLTFKVLDSSSPQQSATTTLTLTIAPAPPVTGTVTVVAGTPQSTAVYTQFSSSLMVRVTDNVGNGVAGAPVTFTAPAGGASGTFVTGGPTATAYTNAWGMAIAPPFVANSVPGTYAVNATISGGAAPAVFALTNTVN